MKVFISWSGPQSKAVALLLKPWLKKILQATQPWMSDLDIDPGSRWSQEIAGQLKSSEMGVICVTPENQNSAWIQFEAGALSMALNDTDRRVVPLLIGFNDRSELNNGPLDVFNNVLFNDEGMWKLISSMNSQLPSPLDDESLRDLFDTFWPKLREDVDALLAAGDLTLARPRSTEQMLADILDTVRDIQKKSRRSITSPFGRSVEAGILGTATLPWAGDLGGTTDPVRDSPIVEMLTFADRIGVQLSIGAGRDGEIIFTTDRPINQTEQTRLVSMALGIANIEKVRFSVRDEEQTGEIPPH